MANEELFIDLEARIAHQDQSIQQLGDEVFRQQKQLRQLAATCQDLLEQFKALSESTFRADTGDEPPPHY